jgi:ribosomal protein L34E
MSLLCQIGIHNWYFDYAGRKTCRRCGKCATLLDGITIVMNVDPHKISNEDKQPAGANCAGMYNMWGDK